jgi:hypothetical protein
MSSQEELRALKQKHAARLWSHPEVCGIDIADDPEGKPVFTVHLKSDDPAARQRLPSDLDGHPVWYLVNPIEKQSRARPADR